MVRNLSESGDLCCFPPVQKIVHGLFGPGELFHSRPVQRSDVLPGERFLLRSRDRSKVPASGPEPVHFPQAMPGALPQGRLPVLAIRWSARPCGIPAQPGQQDAALPGGLYYFPLVQKIVRGLFGSCELFHSGPVQRSDVLPGGWFPLRSRGKSKVPASGPGPAYFPQVMPGALLPLVRKIARGSSGPDDLCRSPLVRMVRNLSESGDLCCFPPVQKIVHGLFGSCELFHSGPVQRSDVLPGGRFLLRSHGRSEVPASGPEPAYFPQAMPGALHRGRLPALAVWRPAPTHWSPALAVQKPA